MINQQQQSAMDDPDEKLQNLKSLSAVLLKENIERQQQVESLLHAKENLEIQLSQIAAGETDSKTESESVYLETMKGMFSVFLENQMDTIGVLVRNLVRENGEKENEIGLLKSEINVLKVKLEGEKDNFLGICLLRDRFMREVDDWKMEANGLREKVIELKERKIRADEETRKFNDQLKEHIDEVRVQRDVAEDALAVKVEAIEDLNRNLVKIVREKNEIERDNGETKIIIAVLEKELSQCSETISSLRNEIRELQCKLIHLDMRGEEKNEKEITIGKLMEEMDSRERLVKNLNAELKDKDGLIETLLREKEEIEDVRVSKENEIVKLHQKLRDAEFTLEASVGFLGDRKANLESQVDHYEAIIERVKYEKRNVLRDLAKETENNKNLTSRVLEMEKQVEELAKTKKEHENLLQENWITECEVDNLLQENWIMECQVDLLRLEKDSLQNSLSEAQREVTDLKDKLESGSLFMAKKAAENFLLVNGKKVLSGTEQKLDEIKLEVVKQAFRSKEAAMEGMKQLMKYLQNSVAKASKQDWLAIIVSFAIILFSLIFVNVD